MNHINLSVIFDILHKKEVIYMFFVRLESGTLKGIVFESSYQQLKTKCFVI